jgi:hypothetical protein
MPEMGRRRALIMHDHHIENMVRRLSPLLKDKSKAERILKKYWSDKMALVWEAEHVYRAANELGLALTEKEAISVLKTLHRQHNAQYGIRWDDITAHVKDNVMGRKLRKREVLKFVHHDQLTIQR